VEVVRTITLVLKSSMEMPLFKWSPIFKNPKWKPMIDVWFRKLKVSVYINIFFNV
jgi:hypothetical protein